MHKIHSTGQFWLIFGTLLLVASLRVLFLFGVACLVHELGHLLALHILGGKLESLSLTGMGAVIEPRRCRMFSYREECLLAIAGPLASLLLAVLAFLWGTQFGSDAAYLLSALSFVLGLFNLLPARPLDGGWLLRSLLARKMGPDAGERIGLVFTRFIAVALLLLGSYLFILDGTFTLLLCSCWLFFEK